MSKRKTQDLWKQLVEEAGEEEIERAASVSVEQAEAELAAAGFDVPAERAKASAFLDELASGAVEAPAVVAVAQEPAPRSVRRDRSRPRPVVMWLAAAATVTVAGGALYAVLQPHAPTPVSPEPPPTSARRVPSTVPDPVAAAELRRQAAAACDAQQWSECLAELDQARSGDPDGDATPTVKATRDRAIRGILEKPKP